MKDLREIAETENLVYIETTSERNGYPANIRGALRGFNDFDHAKEIAGKYDLSIEFFKKRDGWQLWYRTGNIAYEAFRISAEDYGDNYSQFDHNQFQSEEDFIEEEVTPLLGTFNNFEDLQEFILNKKEIWEEIEKLSEGEAILTYMGSYHDKFNTVTMHHYHDTHHEVIGLIEN